MKKNLFKAVCFVFAISLGCSFASARKFPMKEVKPAENTIPAVVVPTREVVETTIKETVDVKTIKANEVKDETAKKADEAAQEVKETVQNAADTAKETVEKTTEEIKTEIPASTQAPINQEEKTTTVEKQEGTIFDLIKPTETLQKEAK